MSYNLWTHLLGMAAGRQLEGEVKVAAGPLLTQALGGVLTAAAVSHFGPGAGAIASAFVGGALKLSPPSGLMTPVAPGTVPLIPAIVQAVSTLVNKPKAAAQAKADQAAKDAETQAAANRKEAEAVASRNAEKILNAQQQALAQQKQADDERKAAWVTEAEQIAETAAEAVLEKFLERSGQFNQVELGKIDDGLNIARAVIGEAEAVAEKLPQTSPAEGGVIAAVTGALHTAGDFVAGVLTKTEDAEAPKETVA